MKTFAKSTKIAQRVPGQPHLAIDKVGYPVILCPACNSGDDGVKAQRVNSSLARFCRNCGRKLSWDEMEENWWLQANKKALQKEAVLKTTARVDLAELDVGLVTLARSYLGYLLIGTTKAGLLALSALSPKNILWNGDTGGEQVVGLTNKPSPKHYQLLLTTKESVFEIDMLNEFSIRRLYRCSRGRYNYRAAIDSAAGIVTSEYDEDSHDHRISFPEARKEPVNSQTPFSQPLGIDKETIFFFSPSNAWLHNLYDNRRSIRLQAHEELDSGKNSFFNVRTQEIFLGGENNILKVKASAPRGMQSVTNRVFFDYDYCPSQNGRELIVVHQKGVTFLNAYNGDILWDMALDLRNEQPANIIKPTAAGHLLVFGMSPGPGRNIRLIDTKSKDRLFHLSTEQPFFEAVEPVFGAGNIIVPTGSEGMELAVFAI